MGAPDACAARWARVAAWHVSEVVRARDGRRRDGDEAASMARLEEDREALHQDIESCAREVKHAEHLRYMQWLSTSFEHGGGGAFQCIREGAAWAPPSVQAGDGSPLPDHASRRRAKYRRRLGHGVA